MARFVFGLGGGAVEVRVMSSLAQLRFVAACAAGVSLAAGAGCDTTASATASRGFKSTFVSGVSASFALDGGGASGTGYGGFGGFLGLAATSGLRFGGAG